ncbi:MAG: PqqD family protein [Planctomycetes bacterium]|nr:PqqD family protein [Planctomycetota bacterium]
MSSRPEKRKNSFESLQDQLASVPLKNEKAREVETEKGQYAIFAVEQKYKGMIKPLTKLLRLKQEKKYRLDGLSLKIFRKIDGKITVGQLIDELMAEYKLTFFESRGLIIHYMQMLMEKGLVVIAAF